MVNLLVVALLLTSCAADTLNVNGFTFYCQKQNGEFIPIANSRVIVRDNNAREDLPDGNGVKEWRTDGFGKISISGVNFGDGHVVNLHIDAHCKARYRTDCPAINIACITEDKDGSSNPWKTLAASYSDLTQRHKFNGGFYMIRTLKNALQVKHKYELPTHMFGSIEELCQTGYEPKKPLSTCSFNSVAQFPHPNYNTSGGTNDFTFYCQKQNGEFIAMANSRVIVRDNSDHVDLKDSNGVREWQTDAYGQISISGVNFADSHKVNLHIDADCKTEYRKNCPAIHNMCQSEEKDGSNAPWKTLAALYSDPAQRLNMNGGFYLIRTPTDVYQTKHKYELPTHKLTADEYCKLSPNSKRGFSVCSFTEVDQFPHPNYRTTPAGGVNGRFVRLAASLP